MPEKIFINDHPVSVTNKKVTGCFIEQKGVKYYKIANYDQMPPFFMSIVSAFDHWMFISSNGSLTAGRKSKDYALFPYYTDDKIHDSAEITGSKTVMFVTKDSKKFLWEPFSEKYEFLYNTEKNIYKSIYGNILIFEEINRDLGITFRYKWTSSDKYGFIRYSELFNNSDETVNINLIDGIQNILPAAVNSDMQTNFSTLVDAYKKSELYEKNIGIYYLSSVPTDKAEPSEGLKANTVWSSEIENVKILLSSRQLKKFIRTGEVDHETNIRAARGAYLINSEFELASGDKKDWIIVSDVNKDLVDIAEINHFSLTQKNVISVVSEAVDKDLVKLKRILSNADGLQLTGDELSSARHISNVMFNVMRGGIFDDESGIDTGSYRCHIENHNTSLFNNRQDFLNTLPDYISYAELLIKVKDTSDPDLIRLTYEYLPLTFSRRHGDPSRPWNQFLIKTVDESGQSLYSYEGNWRDIFQNWEALAMSWPEYIESMIAKFVNASTVDGYNPYRINETGIDWEVIEPDNPWSNIGYWGDHQIIYLQKLLELSLKFNTEKLYGLLNSEIFCFANVPYRIKSYEEICRNPYNTIHFSNTTHNKVVSKSKIEGSDAKLVNTSEGIIFRVNLYEKLLLSLFTKLSNFIPEAGIWLNTQRPEWNDANNALVGYGTSMVTLYYLRRYVVFLNDLLLKSDKEIRLSKEIIQFYNELKDSFNRFSSNLEDQFTDEKRKCFVDAVGQTGSTYRKLVYGNHSGLFLKISINEISSFLSLVLEYIEHSIKRNERTDGLYHSYNLIQFDFDQKTIKINRLYEMLEGQTAVLSSGFLTTDRCVHLLDTLKKSKMFRSDQFSYLLYPDRKLKKFTEKNCIPAGYSVNSNLFKTLDENNDRSLVIRDRDGIFHFNGKFRNAEDLAQALELLSNENYSNIIKNEKDAILKLWEDMFNHREFTGRSGTFFGYEGLGSIYWHMVSKLLLAVGEIYYKAVKEDAEENTLSMLVEHYYEIRAGIGLNKKPDVYGAFPIDPYSHTPAAEGAQQPGMTGQVKEDIISRFFELGVFVTDGQIEFIPALLRKSEFLKEKKAFSYFTHSIEIKELLINENELAFTYCGLPLIYHLSSDQKTELTYDDKIVKIDGLIIDKEISQSIFNREGIINRIDVYLKPKLQ